MAKDVLARMRTSLDLDKAGGAANLHFEQAQWQALTGDHTGAIATLEEAFSTRTIMPIYILVRPAFDPIREHPDFIDLKPAILPASTKNAQLPVWHLLKVDADPLRQNSDFADGLVAWVISHKMQKEDETRWL